MKFFSKQGKITSKASAVPVFSFTRDTSRKLQRFTDGLSKRIVEGRVFLILELAGYLRDQVARQAPEIKIGDEWFDYAKDLRLGLVEGIEDTDAVCIYHKGINKKLTEEDLKNSVLFIKPKMGSPEWVHTLTVFGPWPGYLVPVKLSSSDATIIARTGRPDELDEFARRILSSRQAIVDELNRLRAPDVDLRPNKNSEGLEVHEDLAWHVLRVEFGYGDQAATSHWRPAIRAMMGRVDFVLAKYLDYIMTGKNEFDLPDDASDMMSRMEAQRLANSGHFMQELAPFVQT